MKRILYIVIGISLTACLTEVDLSDLRESPRLVVNGVAVAGEPLRLSVTRTWFYTDDHPNVVIPDATVRLYVNDHYEETIPFVPGDTLFNAAGSYQAAFVPKMADRLRLEVSAPGYEVIHAETVIPQASQLLEAKAVREVSTADSTVKRVVYSISFQDAVEEENYYLFRLEEGNLINEEEATYSWRVLYLDYAEEPLFVQSTSALDQILFSQYLSGYDGRVFSDETINGKSYTIRLQTSTHYVSEATKRLRVRLYAISADYYRYLKTLQDQSDRSFANHLIDAGLAEPIRVYSNIDGGLGIFGGCAPNRMEVDYE